MVMMGMVMMGMARMGMVRMGAARRSMWVSHERHMGEDSAGCSQRHSACIEMSFHMQRHLPLSLCRQMWMHHGQLDKPYLVTHELGTTVKFAIILALMGCMRIMYLALQMTLRLPSMRVPCRSWKYGGRGAVGRHWVTVTTQITNSDPRLWPTGLPHL